MITVIFFEFEKKSKRTNIKGPYVLRINSQQFSVIRQVSTLLLHHNLYQQV